MDMDMNGMIVEIQTNTNTKQKQEETKTKQKQNKIIKKIINKIKIRRNVIIGWAVVGVAVTITVKCMCTPQNVKQGSGTQSS
jgi:hypothetical protein